MAYRHPDTPEIGYDIDAELGFVWLIWGIADDRCDLLAIATNETKRDAYLKGAEQSDKYQLVRAERAYVDHLFGGGWLDIFNESKNRTREKR